MTESSQQPPKPLPGWYPDPSGNGGQAYWDGSGWKYRAGEEVPKKQNATKVWVVIGVAVAVLFVLGTIVNLTKDTGDDEASTTASSTTVASAPSSTVLTPAPAPVPTSAASPVAMACPAAPQDLVDQINGQLAVNNQGWQLANTFIVVSPEGVTYVGGNIMEGDKRISSADVWVAQDGYVIYALSGSAREYTPQLADGRDRGWSAGDEYGQALQDCTIADMRAGNR